MDKEWYERLKERGLTDDSVFMDGRYEELKKALLSGAGEAVILMGEIPDYEKLLKYGYFTRAGANVAGIPSHCHENAEAFANKRKNYEVMTGYALSEDGVWRYHSWNRNKETGVVIETTSPRVMYFGIAS